MIYIVEGHYMRKCEEIISIYIAKANDIIEAEEKAKQADRNSPVADRTNYYVIHTYNDADLDKAVLLAYESWRDMP